MAFKQKPCKIKFTQELKTLDEIYTETIQKFDNVNNDILTIKKKILRLKNKIKDVEDTQKLNEINDSINKLENQISNLENSNDELEYFAKTKDILIQYYENRTKEEIIPDEIDVKPDDMTFSQNTENIDSDKPKDDILDRFERLNEISKRDAKIKNQIKKRRIVKQPEKTSILSLLATDSSGNKLSEPIQQMIHEKGTLKDQYLRLTDASYMCDKVKLPLIRTCKSCSNEMILIQSEGYFICQNCSEAEYVIIESEVPSHKDSMNEKPKYPYNPINHLIEKLNQYQAKQTTVIKPKIYEIIKIELKKRMIELDDVTPELIQDILKKYRKNMYYEHHYLIFSHITNTPPPSITRDEEDDIKKMFKMTEKPFKLFKPDWRDNYLNYSYVLNKLFLIKAETDNNPKMLINAKYFKLLKSRDKLKMQDAIWKKICSFNQWPFHSSF